MTGTAARAAQLQREGKSLPQIASSLGVSEPFATILLHQAAEPPTGVCIYCRHVGPLKPHADSGDLVCADDAACLARGYTTEADGSEVTGRANLAAYAEAARPSYTCPDCGGTGTEPTHSPVCWRRYIATRTRPAFAMDQARAHLAALDVLHDIPHPTDAQALEILSQQALSGAHLRAVLAEIDQQAGASL